MVGGDDFVGRENFLNHVNVDGNLGGAAGENNLVNIVRFKRGQFQGIINALTGIIDFVGNGRFKFGTGDWLVDIQLGSVKIENSLLKG